MSAVDASLGIAHNASEIVNDVPLDAIPVLQLRFPPVFSATATGLKPLSTAPTLPPGSDGWFTLGGVPGQEGEREVRYEISDLSFSPPLPGPPPRCRSRGGNRRGRTRPPIRRRPTRA